MLGHGDWFCRICANHRRTVLNLPAYDWSVKQENAFAQRHAAKKQKEAAGTLVGVHLQEGFDVTTSDVYINMVPTYHVLVHTVNTWTSKIRSSYNPRQAIGPPRPIHPVAWFTRSPDLTLLDYFLWGNVEGLICQTSVESEEDLLAWIMATAYLRLPGIGDRVNQNMDVAEFKEEGGGRAPRKPADRRYRPARFSHARIRGAVPPGIELCSPRSTHERKERETMAPPVLSKFFNQCRAHAQRSKPVYVTFCLRLSVPRHPQISPYVKEIEVGLAKFGRAARDQPATERGWNATWAMRVPASLANPFFYPARSGLCGWAYGLVSTTEDLFFGSIRASSEIFGSTQGCSEAFDSGFLGHTRRALMHAYAIVDVLTPGDEHLFGSALSSYHDDELRIRRPAFDIDDLYHRYLVAISVDSAIGVFTYGKNARRHERTSCTKRAFAL
ncbi:hypothetical protein PR048_028123 [Dryococelus australis]|uniref:Uncharacterized protein n=1 Tax=Dryococelus australis TaxID=614101 RepID=A0ABQ9GIC8_9NEOP|nr:hypothetical protein PR048_028123 [Dryococelus australis]